MNRKCGRVVALTNVWGFKDGKGTLWSGVYLQLNGQVGPVVARSGWSHGHLRFELVLPGPATWSCSVRGSSLWLGEPRAVDLADGRILGKYHHLIHVRLSQITVWGNTSNVYGGLLHVFMIALLWEPPVRFLKCKRVFSLVLSSYITFACPPHPSVLKKFSIPQC